MKLKALDQISISAVKADSLRAGEVFEVSDAYGAELVKALPKVFQAVAEEHSSDLEEKAEPAPLNKAEPAAPANKAVTGRKRKS